MAGHRSKTAVVFLLMLVIGHVPIPWVHSHGDIEQGALANHIAAYHCRVAECDLPNCWHIHWFLLGGITSPTADGWNPVPAPSPQRDTPQQEPVALETDTFRSLDSVCNREQPPWNNIVHTDIWNLPSSRGLPDHLIGTFSFAHVSAFRQLSVMLL
jgi:hypothetical protein